MSHPSLQHLDHRPWPLPAGRWSWRQNWLDLLFAHWPMPAAELRRFVPPSLEIQEHSGSSWVGVIPFRMTGVMRRPLPDLPGISAFPELNVRLYVTHDGKPGVWFLSLDATNVLAVWAAKAMFNLPYYWARMSQRREGDSFDYRSERRDKSAAFTSRHRPISEPFSAQPGSLEHFLTERYCLYSQDSKGNLYCCDVHHEPWPLQRAEAEITPHELLKTHGLAVGDVKPLLHFSSGVHAIVWSLQRVTHSESAI